MDDTDRKILRILQRTPDIALSELGSEVGLSQTPCWRRLKKLERDGIILGHALLLSPSALGLTVNVFAYVKVRSHEENALDEFERAVADHAEIVQCFSMSGDSDFLLRVVVANVEAYEQFLKRKLLHLPGVSSINSSFALKSIKQTTDLPF